MARSAALGPRVAVGVVVVAVAGGAYWMSQRDGGGAPAPSRPMPTAAAPAAPVPLATPPGVVFSSVKVQAELDPMGASTSEALERQVYADALGRTLYTHDLDKDGKPACTGECATAFPALAAPADAQPFGTWSVVTREDGTRQWAHRGKPLYRHAKDEKPKDAKALGQPSWQLATVDPAEGIVLPYGLSVTEVNNAAGHVMVTAKGQPLYAFDGDIGDDAVKCGVAPCPGSFVPLATSQLANPVGDFTVLSRPDGIQQWTYKGRPLYTFDGDVEIGDANGKGVDGRFQLAYVARFFMPSEVAIRPSQRHGGLLATADDRTVYARDRASYNGTGGHNARGGARGNPMVGLQLGVTGCVDECLKSWKPLKAADNAQPSGYWSVMTQPDGSKQWAYQGYALYTYAGERPGEIVGHDSYDLVVNDSTTKLAAAQYGLGLYWRYVAP